jgi:hypothetical protein
MRGYFLRCFLTIVVVQNVGIVETLGVPCAIRFPALVLGFPLLLPYFFQIVFFSFFLFNFLFFFFFSFIAHV